LLDRGEAREHVLHLLLIRRAREVVGEPRRRLAVAAEDVLDHVVGGRGVDVAMDVDAEVAAATPRHPRRPPPGYGTGTREEHGQSPYLEATGFGGQELEQPERSIGANATRAAAEERLEQLQLGHVLLARAAVVHDRRSSVVEQKLGAEQNVRDAGRAYA